MLHATVRAAVANYAAPDAAMLSITILPTTSFATISAIGATGATSCAHPSVAAAEASVLPHPHVAVLSILTANGAISACASAYPSESAGGTSTSASGCDLGHAERSRREHAPHLWRLEHVSSPGAL